MSVYTSNFNSPEGLENTLWSFEHYESSSNDDNSIENMSSNNSTIEESSSPDYVPGTFEGPEKTMEVVFVPGEGMAKGLRNLTRDQLDYLCTKAKCTILSKISSNYVDAYVLSESSLFIYDYRCIMKTCGTTTLLRCLSSLLEFADDLQMQLSWVGYSRKNFNFPSAQQFPHGNFNEEMSYIDTHEYLQDRISGTGYILGPITADHWFVYFANANDRRSHSKSVGSDSTSSESYGENSEGAAIPSKANYSPSSRAFDALDIKLLEAIDRKVLSLHSFKSPLVRSPSLLLHGNDLLSQRMGSSTTYRTINMMMFDMDSVVASIFYQGTNGLTGKEMTMKADIASLCPGALIDEAAFTPCGYSMNALLHDAYTTIHITPEPQCSYVSFETNASLENYDSLVRNVLGVFRPRRFVLTMFGVEAAMDCIKSLPTNNRCYELPMRGCYSRTSSTSTFIEQQEQLCIMSCYTFSTFNATSNSGASSVVRGNSPELSYEVPLRRNRSYTMH